MDGANSNTGESLLNVITLGGYSILHNDNDRIHIEFTFPETVYEVDIYLAVYDYASDFRVKRSESFGYIDVCTGGVKYNYEERGFPRHSQGLVIAFSYRINSSHYESYTTKAHNELSLEGIVTSTGKFMFDPLDASSHLSTYKEVAKVTAGSTFGTNDPVSDYMMDQIKEALNEILDKNPVWALFSFFEGVQNIGTVWVNLLDILDDPDKWIFEGILYLLLSIGIAYIYSGKLGIGIFIILICIVPMFYSESSLSGAFLHDMWDKIK